MTDNSPEELRKNGGSPEEFGDIESYLESRAKMEAMFEEKFTKTLTVMFTDMKDSTSITETQGDLAMRQLIKQHNEILFPRIKQFNGTLVKTIGDGSLSYFESAQDCLRAAVSIQQAIDEHNLHKLSKIPLLVRIGMHTGKVILEKNDIYGDVVNTAARVETAAGASEIFLSEASHNALEDKGEVYCRFVKTTSLKGKKELFNIYKAFWNPSEIEADKAEPVEVEDKKKIPWGVKVAIMVVAPVLVVFLLMQLTGVLNFGGASADKRTISDIAK